MTTALNKACCSIPPVQAEYTPKGTFEEFAGFKCYVTGDKSSKTAVVGIYDVFGYYPQTQQGADILASLGNYVILPDFLKGNTWPMSRFPPKSDIDKKEFGEWFATIGNIKERVPEVESIVEALGKEGKSVGLYGLCWGGKIATLAGGGSVAPQYLKGVAALHPALVDPKDAEALKVPIAMFPSKDEDKEVLTKQWKIVESKEFASKSAYRYYGEMIHGFAGSRADLSNPDNARDFGDVYSRLGAFYKMNLV